MKLNTGSTGDGRPPSVQLLLIPRHLLGRLYLLAVIGATEGALIGVLRVGPTLHSHLLPIAAVAFGVFLALGRSRLKVEREDIPFGSILFAGYLLCMAIGILFRLLSEHPGTSFLSTHAASIASSPVLLLRVPLLLAACLPFRDWVKAIRVTNMLWFYSLLAGVAAWALGSPIRLSYSSPASASSQFLQTITIRSLQVVLGFLSPGIVVDEANYTIGTSHFSVYIRGGCSGVEGLGMVLAFTSIWLWYSRKECRFPQALMLIPFALVCIWWLNIVRLSILILVGDAISPEIAMIGVHSHVGWIAFIVVALAFFLATQRLAWVRKMPSCESSTYSHAGTRGLTSAESASGPPTDSQGESPVIRAYLVPFLAILAASFVSKSASGYFEWLYPLRFVAAAFALWYFRPELKKLNWRFGWLAPLSGVAVFLLWIAPSWWMHQRAAGPLGPALAALSPTGRWTWIAFRVTAAVFTVPIAEELAFRGYLARRFVSREFDEVSFSKLKVLPVLLSSVAFGSMHMQNLTDWRHLALGTLAGLAFAGALRWKGRMGDAVVAHAICNLLLAAWVLGFGDWAQW